jgi:hypothetical protein
MRQTSFPSQIAFLGGAVASAICADALPDLDRDAGACCWLSGRPRYALNGVEAPTFDPTIPPDLVAEGWWWWGTCLVRGEIVIAAAESLAHYWDAARRLRAEACITLELPGQPMQLALF